MPIKYNLTKYDKLFSRIKKVSTKKDREMTKEETCTMFKAVLLAAFASGHSWQTFRTLTAEASASFNKPEIKKEYEDAATNKWKSVQPSDINEVANSNISEGAFSAWLFFNVQREYHDQYKRVWSELQADFARDCDSVERDGE